MREIFFHFVVPFWLATETEVNNTFGFFHAGNKRSKFLETRLISRFASAYNTGIKIQKIGYQQTRSTKISVVKVSWISNI